MKKIITLLLLTALLLTSSLFLVSCDEEEPKETAPTETEPKEEETVVPTPSVGGISVRDFGAVGDNTADDTEAIKEAASQAKSLGCGLVFPAGKYRITQNITFPVAVRVEYGALLCPESDKVKLAFSSALEAGLYRIFSNDGKVTLNGNNTSYPEWFGASADGRTNSTSAIQRAIDCFPVGYGRVEFAAGNYLTDDTIRVSSAQSHLTLAGVARQSRELFPGIECESRNNPVLSLVGASGGNAYDGGLEDVTVENLEFKRKNMGGENTDTVYVENTIYTTFRNCGFSYSQNGLRAVNVNGLRLYTVHTTVGADLPGKEVRGVFIDGSKKGSTGILIDDFLFYTYASPTSVNIGYKDVNKAGSLGDSVGDRRIKNFECSGPCQYGIWMEDAGGFCGDVSIMEFSMDCIKSTGIYIKGPKASTAQQVNIVNAYLRLEQGDSSAAGVKVTGYANTHLTNVHVDNAAGANLGISLSKTVGGALTACSFDGVGLGKAVSLVNCQNIAVTGCSSNVTGQFTLTGCTNCVVSGNTMPQTVPPSSGTTNLILNNLFRK